MVHAPQVNSRCSSNRCIVIVSGSNRINFDRHSENSTIVTVDKVLNPLVPTGCEGDCVLTRMLGFPNNVLRGKVGLVHHALRTPCSKSTVCCCLT